MSQNDLPKLSFASDYMEGAHPSILRRLAETNLQKISGYGGDEICRSAADRIRAVCSCPDAKVHFLVGGTQTNATVIGAILKSYQGVLAADTGHISVHEAGAIEHGAHKVLTIPHIHGKLTAEGIRSYLETFYADDNHEHMVMPGMVYISHPTEYGTLYSLDELTAIREVCKEYALPLFLDGARLAYGLSCPESDVTLPDLARLCDVFYIGGTKCGALFGEAVVIPDPSLIPHFFTIIKQCGALSAKGWLLGIQFDELFTDDLYLKLGKSANEMSAKMRAALTQKGYTLCFDSPTNQVFVLLEDEKYRQLSAQAEFSFWEKPDEDHTIVRLASSWATTPEQVDQLLDLF